MKKKTKRKIKRVTKILLIMVMLLTLIHFIVRKNEPDNYELDNNYNVNDMSDYQSYDDVSILKYEKGTIKERLKEMAKKEPKINTILSNYNSYPEELMEALSRNMELTNFVLDYPENKGKVYSNTIGKFNGSIPELYQWDERWGYGSYGKSNIAISGCGPTALAMVVAGLKKDNTITPYKVAKLSESKGYYIPNVGTTWDLITKGGEYYGLKVKELPLDEEVILEALKNNHPIICSMRKGDFTINGHFIVLVSYENGKIKVNDPNSQIRSNILWDYDKIKSQIKNLWEFSL